MAVQHSIIAKCNDRIPICQRAMSLVLEELMRTSRSAIPKLSLAGPLFGRLQAVDKTPHRQRTRHDQGALVGKTTRSLPSASTRLCWAFRSFQLSQHLATAVRITANMAIMHIYMRRYFSQHMKNKHRSNKQHSISSTEQAYNKPSTSTTPHHGRPIHAIQTQAQNL